MDIDLSEYIGEYCAELFEQLEELQARLLDLEQQPSSKDIVNEIFRIAHTIKGSAATMGFNDIAGVAHAFEDLLGEVREGTTSITEPVFKSFLDAYDFIKTMADSIQDESGAKPVLDMDGLVTRLRSLMSSGGGKGGLKVKTKAQVAAASAKPAGAPLDRLTDFTTEDDRNVTAGAITSPGTPAQKPAAAAAPSSAPSGAGLLWRITMTFDPDVDMRSVRAFLVINHLRDVGELLATNPSPDDIEQDRFGETLELLLHTTTSRDEIFSILEFGEAKDVEVICVPPGTVLDGAPSAAPARPAPAPAPAKAPAAPAAAPASPAADDDASGEEFLKQLLGGGADHPEAPAPVAAPHDGPVVPLVNLLNEDQKNLVIESINQDLNVFEALVTFRDNSPQAMLRAMTVMNYLGEMSRVVRADPTKHELEEGAFEGRLHLVLATEKEISQLRELLLSEEISHSTFTPITLDGLDIVSLDGEAPRLERTSETASAILPQVKARPAEDRKAGLPTVRVTVDRLDYLMNLVGELVIKKTQLNQVYSEFDTAGDVEQLRLGIQELNQGLDRITSDLQSGIMKVRMVQIGQVFYRFSRLVRDLSKNLGKEVEFLIEGAETELDKTVIDEIGDPLMHLIRNCLDHGIEKPEDRRRMGKPEKGILLLRAQHAGNHIIVETADDGAGIDTEAVKRKAIEKGLVTASTAAKLTPQEINGFIFMPGFSTSGSVTNVSGRGVGMDVVKDTIERLQGDIQIKSERNVGTTMQIKLPLTLAIIQGLLVRVCGEKFCIPLSTVAETVQLGTTRIHTINGQRVVTIRDEVIPLIYLQEFFNLPPRHEDNKFFIVLAGDVDNKVGLVVNHLYGRREIVIKSLNRKFTSVKGFAGGTVLGDGTVSLILDIPVLVEESRRAFLSGNA